MSIIILKTQMAQYFNILASQFWGKNKSLSTCKCLHDLTQTVLLSFFEVFNPRLAAWAKLSLSRAQNIFTPATKIILYSFIFREENWPIRAEPGGHWCFTFALGPLGILIFFIEMLC